LLEDRHQARCTIVGGSPRTLKQRLQSPEGFHSYGEISTSHRIGLDIAYKTVYQLVHQLKAKLKVPRPQSLKQHPESQS